MKLSFFVFALIASLNLIASPFAQAQSEQVYLESSTATQAVADQYFKAYIALDWDKLATFAAEDISFIDPTTEHLFGSVGQSGKAALIQKFRSEYASIKKMIFTNRNSFVSGDYAIYSGELEYWLAYPDDKLLKVKAMPFVSILKVQHGLVIEHKDFADYHSYLAALKQPPVEP